MLLDFREGEFLSFRSDLDIVLVVVVVISVCFLTALILGAVIACGFFVQYNIGSINSLFVICNISLIGNGLRYTATITASV